MITLRYDNDRKCYTLNDIIMFCQLTDDLYEYTGTYSLDNCKRRSYVIYNEAVRLSIWEHIQRAKRAKK